MLEGVLREGQGEAAHCHRAAATPTDDKQARRPEFVCREMVERGAQC